MSWGKRWPSPRRKDSLSKWVRFEADSSKTLKYEVFPLEIVAHGDTAVALYNPAGTHLRIVFSSRARSSIRSAVSQISGFLHRNFGTIPEESLVTVVF